MKAEEFPKEEITGTQFEAVELITLGTNNKITAFVVFLFQENPITGKKEIGKFLIRGEALLGIEKAIKQMKEHNSEAFQ